MQEDLYSQEFALIIHFTAFHMLKIITFGGLTHLHSQGGTCLVKRENLARGQAHQPKAVKKGCFPFVKVALVYVNLR